MNQMIGVLMCKLTYQNQNLNLFSADLGDLYRI